TSTIGFKIADITFFFSSGHCLSVQTIFYFSRRVRISGAVGCARGAHMSVTTETARWPATAEPRPWITEDWLSVWIALRIFALALALLWGVDLLGWVVTTSGWIGSGRA